MQGRLEHTLQTMDNTQKMVEQMPPVVQKYYTFLKSSIEASSTEEYIRKLKFFLDYINNDISKINFDNLTEYMANIKFQAVVDSNGNPVVNPKTKKVVVKQTSMSYLKTTWTALNKFCKYLVTTKVLAENPMEQIPREKSDDVVKRIFLDSSDLTKILNAVDTGAGNKRSISKQKAWKDRDKLILFLFMVTGMRKTALSEININDIKFSEAKIYVIDKGRKSLEYDITPKLSFYLDNWLKRREEILAGEECDALFISSQKRRMTPKSIYNIVSKYSLEGLGFSISPHKLRGAFITILYENNGHDIEAARVAVGHSSVTTTSRYINSKNNARSEASSFMSQIL